jgi:Mn2+/Fe2+ NRAMP family transporter
LILSPRGFVCGFVNHFKGLTGTIKEHYTRSILIGVVLLVVVANTINIGADIGAVATAAQLIIDVPRDQRAGNVRCR